MDSGTVSEDERNNSTPLPELSFDDLLDVSPTKSKESHVNAISGGDNGTDHNRLRHTSDSSDLDDMSSSGMAKKTSNDETLHTPSHKRPPPPAPTQSSVTAKVTTASGSSRVVMGRLIPGLTTSSPVLVAPPIVAPTTAATTTAATPTVATTTSMPAPILLNTKNILPKSTTIFPNQLIKITPKINSSPIEGLTSIGFSSNSTGNTDNSTSSTTTTITTATTTIANTVTATKTAVKTANGQIVYIKKTGGGQVRIQPTGSNTTATTTSIAPIISKSTASGLTVSSNVTVSQITSTPTIPALTTTTTPNTVVGSKTVAFQVIRSADGKFVPVKPNATASGGVATMLGTKKLTTSNTQSPTGPAMVIKASPSPSSPITPTTTSSIKSNATTVTTTIGSNIMKNVKIQKVLTSSSSGGVGTSTIPNTSGGNVTAKLSNAGGTKIVVQSANGKQIVVSNQHLIKLSPQKGSGILASNTVAASSAAGVTNDAIGGISSSSTLTTTPISTAGNSLQLLGKPGVHVVRVVAGSKLASVVAAAKTNASGTTSSVTSTGGKTMTTALIPTTSSTTPTTYKILNPTQPSKLTVVQSHNPSGTLAVGKLVVPTTPQSPKKDQHGNIVTSATFSPVSAKLQKTMVTVPTLRAIGGSSSSSSSLATTSDDKTPTTPTSSSGGRPNGTNSITTQQRKFKIAEINSAIQRFTAGDQNKGSGVKRDDGGDNDDNASSTNSEDGNINTKIKHFAVSGKRIVVMGRHPSVKTTQSAITSVTNSETSATLSRPIGVTQRIMLQGTAKTTPTSSPASSTVSSTTTTSTTSPNINKITKKFSSVLRAEDIRPNNDSSARSFLERKSLPESLPSTKSIKLTNSEQEMLSNKTTLLVKKRIIDPIGTAVLASSGTKNVSVKSNTSSIAGTDATTPSATSSSTAAAAMAVTIAASVLNVKDEPLDDIKPLLEDGALVRRKHCNCSKSQCLKLYCDCFANGEFCQDCTCKDCCNNLKYEDERQTAIRNCLERNPSAFKPKITTRDQGDMRLHNKGCNCKRSGCLKNYCECYEAKIPCSSNCKCVGCRNFEFHPDLDRDHSNMESAHMSRMGQKRNYEKAMGSKGGISSVNAELFGSASNASSGSGSDIAGNMLSEYGPNTQKQQCNLITQEVIDATIQCMISQADECEKNDFQPYQTEKMVMEECGRCLVEIIDFSIRNADSSYAQD